MKLCFQAPGSNHKQNKLIDFSLIFILNSSLTIVAFLDGDVIDRDVYSFRHHTRSDLSLRKRNPGKRRYRGYVFHYFNDFIYDIFVMI